MTKERIVTFIWKQTEVGNEAEGTHLIGDDMTKYQEVAQLKRAIKRTLKNRKVIANLYQFPHVEKQKKPDSEWPAYITDNPFYP